ncbi:MAG: DUF2703 domain-containing protein [Planctomycetes bacterium]|nr:DUF2703 domain-containing protein [Planctomycetota bacterium]
MKTLTIRWQRLLDEKGQTCERCGLTGKEVQKALAALRKSMRPVGIRVVLEQEALSPEACVKDISQSNRIWIAERPLEEWLGAETGKSPCASCCAQLGDAVECRTIAVGGKTYEAIPAELIIRAGLRAGTQLLEAPARDACCPPSGSTQPKDSGCCPRSAQCQDRCAPTKE